MAYRMTDAEREYLQEQVGEEAYLDGMKASRKLLERWGALIYVDTLGYQWQAGLYDAIQDVRLGLPINELPTDTDTFASAKALAEAEVK